MSTVRHICFCSTLLVVLLLVACATDDAPDGVQGHTLHLMAGQQTLEDVAVSTTRSFSVNSVQYDPLTTPGASIRVYITTSGRLDFYGDFDYDSNDGEWAKKVPLDNDNYYIYGLMPSSLMNTTIIETRSGNHYANGAVLTIGNVPSLMTDDFCAIVGVQRAQSKTDNIATSGIQRGNFSYEVNRSDDDNYAYLLLDHVYACLRFTMAVDANYAALRKIHLKAFSITPKAARFNVRATMTPDATSALTATFVKTGDGGATQPLWAESKDITLSSTTASPTQLSAAAGYQNIYIAPSVDNVEFTITSTYDVYDKDGKNLIRKDCVATNKLSLSGVNLKPGDRYTVPLVVMPTYLYVLSEPDLDNPTVPDVTL